MPDALDPDTLGMAPHPEGGWYRETWRHATMIDTARGRRHLTTCVAFLLQPGQVSTWHRVRSAELWLWQGGGPLELTVGGTGDTPRPGATHRLAVGDQHLVAADEWQTARPAGNGPVLVACVVAPGFDFADFSLAEDAGPEAASPEATSPEPADAEPADAEPADAEPPDAEPADAELADAEPADPGGAS